MPDESTFRRVFAALDADALDAVLGAWVTAATSPDAGTRRIAVAGKTLNVTMIESKRITIARVPGRPLADLGENVRSNRPGIPHSQRVETQRYRRR